jgi:hypothetical protein
MLVSVPDALQCGSAARMDEQAVRNKEHSGIGGGVSLLNGRIRSIRLAVGLVGFLKPVACAKKNCSGHMKNQPKKRFDVMFGKCYRLKHILNMRPDMSFVGSGFFKRSSFCGNVE